MKNRVISSLLLASMVSACSSTQTSVVNLEDVGKEEVLKSYGDADELKEALPFAVDSGKVVVTGLTTMPADNSRPEAGIKMAQMQARAELAKAIQLKIENFAQLSEEGVSADTTQLRGIATEVAKLTTNDLRPGKTYYEKVKVISDSGTPRTEYRIWAEVTCDEAMFKRHVMDAIRNQNGKSTFSKEFAATVDANWKKVLGQDNADAAAKSEDGHKPASVSDEKEEE